MKIRFKRLKLKLNDALDPDSTELVLKAKAADGIFISGSDYVRVVQR